MRKTFTMVLALVAALSTAVSAATLSPIQLLNPTGSTSGQAILSTGPTTAPIWGGVTATSITGVLPVSKGGTNVSSASGTALDNITGFASTGFITRTGAGTYGFQSTTNGITLGNLAQSAANTVLANATGSTANVTAFSVPTCSATGNALNWTSGSGFTCGTGYALLASPAFTGTVNTAALTASGAITPSQTAGIVGTTAVNNANAGSVGEYVTATGTGVSLTTATTANITSISLTAGDWDVTGNIVFIPAGATSTSLLFAGVSTTTATLPTVPQYSVSGSLLGAGAGFSLTAPFTRINVSVTTTVFLTAQATFTGGTETATGIIRARRVR